ncbi:hypothetical protein JCM6882_006662 [Rhodosporidiobolus microsporus]
MVGERVGYGWAAQDAFAACSGNVSISEWFLTNHDKCCGLAPNPPITGPGTIIVFTLGTFFNLLITLSWKSEGPYNLLGQVLATDGAFFALIARLSEDKNRLTEFHAAFVPLAIMSCLPVAVAALTVESWYLHNVSLPAFISLLIAELDKTAAVKETTRPSHKRAITAPEFRKLPGEERQRQKEEWRNIQIELLKNPNAKKRSWLTPLICIVFVVHVVAWLILFTYIFVVNPDPALPVCSEELNIRRYRIIIGCMCLAFTLFTCIIFLPLFLAFSKSWRARHKDLVPDVLEFWGGLLCFGQHVEPALVGYNKSREIIRYSFSILFFFAFFGCYLGVWISSLNEFVLMGDTPFDYGQIAACFNILVPVCVTARTWLDQRDSWNSGVRALQAQAKDRFKDLVLDHETVKADLVKAKEKRGTRSRLRRPFRKSPRPFNPDLDIPLKKIPKPILPAYPDPGRPPSLYDPWSLPSPVAKKDAKKDAKVSDDGGRSSSSAGGSRSSSGGRRRSLVRTLSGRSRRSAGDFDSSASISGRNPVMTTGLGRGGVEEGESSGGNRSRSGRTR